MRWRAIDSSSDLAELDASATWEDARVVAFYAIEQSEPYYPSDISRSGYVKKNLHLLCSVPSPHGEYLEVAFIHCDWFAFRFFEQPHFAGRVDTLKRVELRSEHGDVDLQAARIIYRFVNDPTECESRFPHSGIDA